MFSSAFFSRQGLKFFVTLFQVCNTRLPSSVETITNSTNLTTYFYKETQFGVATILGGLVNNAPNLTGPSVINITEDSGMLDRFLCLCTKYLSLCCNLPYSFAAIVFQTHTIFYDMSVVISYASILEICNTLLSNESVLTYSCRYIC